MTESQTSHDTPADVPIVAIGSSAGGITALQKLFEGLPASSPARSWFFSICLQAIAAVCRI